MAPNSGAPSSTREGTPRRASASAVVRPPSPPPTMRMGSRANIKAANNARRLPYHTNPLDLPVEIDAGGLLHAGAHGLAQGLDIGGGGVAEVDQEVAVHLRDLGVADLDAAAAGGVDQLPGLASGRILEGGAAGAALDRLRGLARLGDLVHLGGNRGAVAGPAGEQRLREDDVIGRATMPIPVVHVAI